MDSPSPVAGRSRKGLWIAGAVGSLAVAVAVVLLLLGRAERRSYVRETLAILPDADKAYSAGKFSDATATTAAAVARLAAHTPWFEPVESAAIRDAETFYAAQLALWRDVETSYTGTATDPAKARAELEALAAKAREGAPRSRPLVDRIDAHLSAALNAERTGVVNAATAKIPEAQKAYEQGLWEAFLNQLAEIRKPLETLPPASRDAAAKQLDESLQPVEALAAPLATMKSIKEGTEEGFIKADRLRALIPGLKEPKGRDRFFHQDLFKAIADVDPETRRPIAGAPVPSENRTKLIEAFTKGGDFQVVGKPDDRTVIELQGPIHKYAIRIVGRPPQLLIEVDRVRLLFPINLMDNREAESLATAAELSRALRAAKHAAAFADEAWSVRGDAPGPCAVYAKEKQALVVLGGRLYEGAFTPEADGSTLVQAYIQSAKALEAAVGKSESIHEELRGPLSALLKASHARAPPADHLDSKFCREAVQSGYVEAQAGTSDAAVVERLKEFRRAYGEVSKRKTRIDAKAADGATAELVLNLEGDGYWRLHDPAADTTTFSMNPRDHMGTDLAVVSVFPGRLEAFPDGTEPTEIRMVQPLAGVAAKWTAGGKLEVDPAKWTLAVTLGGGVPEHFGSGDWQVPPHALKVDGRGQAVELILPAGALKVGSFDAIPAGAARREAEESFLDRCATVLRSPGEFHLFYRYFVQYVLDSPVTTATTLIGSSKHSGDAHQDAFQTLDRRLNGRFLADCDDLAELYWTILRRQDRPAFVLGVPGHATCGVAEKNGDEWEFFCVDTGPARRLRGADLDAVVERLLRTYDTDGSMSFDPRQMRFLFRFGGEQTRSDYFLDSRILRDPAYADLMIRVQEYWHFGFYALGIETMSKVLESDRMPANCQEIAGLYTRVGLWENALQWTQEGIKGLEAKDRFTGLSDTMRVVECLKELKRKDEAVKTLSGTAGEIAKILQEAPQEADRYRRLKFQVGAELAENGLPWRGWALVGEEVTALVKAGAAAEFLMAMTAHIYGEMLKTETAKLTEEQARDVRAVRELLEEYFDSGLFEADDSNLDLARKYGQLYNFRVALLGRAKAAEELIKAEYPKSPKRPKDAVEALDWPWIRLSVFAYAIASGHALDKDDPAAGGPPVAIAVIRALEAALPEIRRQGSLGPVEFAVLDLRLLRSCLEMDEKGVRSVFDEMKRQGWGELFENVSRTLGRAAEFMKVGDFEKVFRIYCGYEVPRRHYYGVVYAASAVDRRGHALAASRICLEKFPGDGDMKREHALLEKLAK